jgi:hypothetical protein
MNKNGIRMMNHMILSQKIQKTGYSWVSLFHPLVNHHMFHAKLPINPQFSDTTAIAIARRVLHIQLLPSVWDVLSVGDIV